MVLDTVGRGLEITVEGQVLAPVSEGDL